MALSTTIKSIQDIMRKDVGVDGDAQRIGQLVWLLFLKIWNDREQELELLEDHFASPLTDVTWVEDGESRTALDLRWSAWAADPEGETGDKLLGFVNDTLFPALKGMEAGPAVAEQDARLLRRRLVRSVFEDAYQYMKSGTLLRQVVNKIQADIDFNDAANRHLFGNIYEQLLKDLQNAGNAGPKVLLLSIKKSVVVAVHTDSYSSREWCRREIIEAKRWNVPMIVVNSMRDVDERGFPYMGNVPIVRMNPNKTARIEKIIGHLLDEVFKDFLWRCRIALTGDVSSEVLFMPRHPELISLANLPTRTEVANPIIVYPDPQLGD